MKRWFFIVIVLLGGFFFVPNGLSATYNATGIWDYNTYGNWANYPCTKDPDESGSAIIIQEGNTFTIAIPDLAIAVNGTVSSSNYVVTTSIPEEDGKVTLTWSFNLSSSTDFSGSVNWTWTDGASSCSGGNSFNATKRQTTATYNATGTWDYQIYNNWSSSGCTADDPETSSATVNQIGTIFTITLDEGTYKGVISGPDYLFVYWRSESGGTTYAINVFTLTSNTSGSGTTDWYWTDGWWVCAGGGLISIQSSNNNPFIPSNPSPGNNATDLALDTHLSWTGGDSDAGDLVTYDVYFGTSTGPPLVASNQVDTSYSPTSLEYGTTYYWKIVAKDNHGGETEGSVWNFRLVADSDGDGIGDNLDSCPNDPNKTELGICGCGVADTDSDSDGTPDCVDADSDNDEMPNTWEEQYGLNPLMNDASGDVDGDGYSNLQEYKSRTDPTDPNSKPTDINGDGIMDIGDSIVALQVLSGTESSSTVSLEADINDDAKIGLEEAIYILQRVSGLR